MKILLVNDYATRTGGAEILLLNHRDQLRRHGHQVHLFASQARTGGAPLEADATCLGTTSRWRTLLQTVNPWAYHALRRELAQFKPDVVHVTLYHTQLSPLILPLLRGIPSVYYAVWHRAVCPKGTKLLPGGALCSFHQGRACLKQGCLPWRDFLPLFGIQLPLSERWQNAFRHAVATSRTVQEVLEKDGIRVDRVIGGGVPPQPPRPPLAGPPVIAFVGRLVLEKGAPLLIEAFELVRRRMPSVRLKLLGDGPEMPRLRQRLRESALDSAVELPGHVTHERLGQFLADAWVQVVPSLWAEPFGLVAVESMMRGTAVVASNWGGLAEVVVDGVTGLLVPPGDAKALARALLTILSDSSQAELMGRAGRERAQTFFSIETCCAQFEQVYGDLIS